MAMTMIQELAISLILTTTCIIIILGTVESSPVSNAYCKDETPTDDEPSRPKMNYSFTTEISGRWVDLQGMAYLYEYYDQEEKKLAYDSLSDGLEYSEVYDFNSRSLLFSIHERCTFLRDYDTITNITEKGLRSLDILLNLGSVWKYKGNTTIRGVGVQQWRSCGGWSWWANFTADYYFTEKDLHPFRLEMQGVKKPSGSDTNTDFHRIYDYVFFRKAKPPSSVFKPPPGEFCKGHVQTTTPMPSSASYRVEEINPIEKTVTNTRVLYDKQRGLSREETDKTTIISDFKRGFQFEIDKKTGTCSRKPFYSFENSHASADSKSIIHIATLKYFFMDDKDFTHNGVHRARGISCDLYTKKSHAAEYLGISVVEVFMARPGVYMTNELWNTTSSLRQPVQIVMKGGPDRHDLRDLRQFEIYDFEPGQNPVFDPNDITSCFSREETVHFSMIYEGNGTNSLDGSIDLMRNLSEKISTDLGISPLRVSITNAFIVGEGQIKVLGSLFGAGNETLVFQTVPNTQNVINRTADLYFVLQNSSNTPTICAEFCFDESTRPFDYTEHFCWAFQFDRQTRECTFFFQEGRSLEDFSVDLAYSDYTDLYKRSPPGDYNTTSVLDVWNFMENGVEQGFVEYTDGKGNVLRAVFVSQWDGLGNSSQFQESWDRPMSQFYNVSEVLMRISPMEVVARITLVACARRCVNSPVYSCEAFEYDAKTMECSLYNSTSYGDRYAQESVTATRVAHIRDFTSNFEMIFGRTFLSPDKDPVYTEVDNVDSCAKLCVRNTDFNCQSFEMCGDGCLLGKYHIFDVPPKAVKENYTSCVHYSRNYIHDYNRLTHEHGSNFSSVVEIANIGVKQCATICSTSMSYDCDVFEFCDSDSDSTCRLSATNYTTTTTTTTAIPSATTTPTTATTTLLQSANNSASQNAEVCAVYSRKPLHHRFINPFKFERNESESESGNDDDNQLDGHTLESMISMAVGMFCCGLTLMLVISMVIVVIKRRGTSQVRVADMNTVTYSKDNTDSVTSTGAKENYGFTRAENVSTRM